MKILSVILLGLFLSVEVCYSQVTINNIQRTSTIIAPVDASTPNNPNSYTWSEISNTKQGVHISVIPPERMEIDLQQNNSWINYNTWNWGYMMNLQVSYDGGSWQTIFSNQIKDATGWIQSPFSTLGYHTISLKWISFAEIVYNRFYDVCVVPQSQKFYKDNYGNTLTTWEGGNPNKVVLISEGFDPYNTTYSEYLRYKGKALFDPFIQAGYKIYFLNYAYNSQDMRNSAAIYNSASRYISTLNSNTQMIAAGISMGGVIVRYALAKAENDGNPLPFNKFLSIDAPQQNALFDRDLQDYMKGEDLSGFQKHGLDNDAAKQLLTYNTYGDLHTSFYNELNSLRGGRGYPSLTENIGVSFSNGIRSNFGFGRWVVITYQSMFVPGTFILKESFLNAELKVSGSYLPKSSVESEITPFFLGMIKVERDPNNNPTFIPHSSALDIVNGNSKFDVTIQANANYFHDQFPPEVVTALITKFLPLSASISGPTYLAINQSGNWTASALGGTPPYHYQWWYMHPSTTIQPSSIIKPNNIPVDTWFTLGTDSPTLSRYDLQNFNLKCVVTDANTIQVTSNIISVEINGSLAKISGTGEEKVNHILALAEEFPTEYSLGNYPNPFNPTTKIGFSIPNDSHVSLKVYDAFGREVAVLTNQAFLAGRYEFDFDASSLSSGTYIYSLRTGNKTITRKMLLVK